MMIAQGPEFFFIDTIGKAAEFEIGIDFFPSDPRSDRQVYKSFDYDDAIHICINTIGSAVDAGAARLLFENQMNSISKSKSEGTIISIDIKRFKSMYCD